MMPSAHSTAAATGHDAVLRNWKSPIPYLFGGLALMLGLVAVALLILACSFHKTPSSNSSTSSDADQDQKPTRPVDIEAADSEPKIVVIMAGEKTATYLAKPIDDEDEEKPAKPMNAVFDDERMIAIVIMAGEDKPTHLATEIIITSPTCYCSCSSETDQKA
ncbi:hypothetical protein ACE6H2_012033 [Prunus campanulata]